MRLKKTTLFLSLITFLYANDLSTDNFLNLETLEKKEKSLEKDFYIWKYIEENSEKYQNIIDALGQSSNVTNELFFKYAENLGHDETLAVAQCMQADEKSLIQTHNDCIKAGLTLEKAIRLSPLELNSVITKVENNYPTFAKELKIINSSIPFTKIVSSNKETIYNIYLNSDDNFLYKKLNYKFPTRTIGKIIDDVRFDEFLSKIVSNPKLNFLQSSFFDIDDTNLSSKSSFLLAMNRVLNKKFGEKTISYLDNAYNKSLDSEEKEKILFWKYQLLKDENYLLALSQSTNINIYTIYAKQFLKQELLIDNTIFKTSLDEYLTNCNLNKKIILNSMAKELSSFDKNKIEFLNLGIFQINVKNAEKFADEYDFIFDYSKLFDIKESLLYFNISFQEVETSFQAPIFQFFAYKDGTDSFEESLSYELFDLNNSFEPYLSLEIYKNKKSAQFVKNLLANYIIYYKLYKKEELLLDNFLKNSIESLDYTDF